jgi:type III secretion protein T
MDLEHALFRCVPCGVPISRIITARLSQGRSRSRGLHNPHMFESLTDWKIKELIYPLMVVLPRIFGFWLAFPLFGHKGVPMMVRNGLAVAVAVFIWPATAARMPNPMPTVTEWTFLVPKELALGFFVGFSLGVVVWALESVGTLIDTQSGTNNAAQMDPNAGAPLGPTGTLLRQYAVALLLVSGVLLQFVFALAHSFKVWPWHAWWPDTQALSQTFFLVRTELYWQLVLQLVAPVMLALLLTEVGLGLINRATPQFDVYRIAMSVKVLLAAIAIAITATVWAHALQQLYREDAARILQIVGAAAR